MTRTNTETAATRPIGADLDALAQLVAQGRPHSFGYKGEMTDATNLNRKLDLFDEHWQPKIVAQVNDYDVRIVKVKGEFVWHKHDHTDDFFLVLKGHLTIQLRDRNVELDEGELSVVPKGVLTLSTRRGRSVRSTNRAERHRQHRRRWRATHG